MAKSQTQYICSHCNGTQMKWMGKCPNCGEWNTLQEVEVRAPEKNRSPMPMAAGASRPTPLPQITLDNLPRLALKSAELSRVLGGGIVPGSCVLVGGDPGIGKCVTGDTRVLDPSTGEFLPITAWQERLRPVLTFDFVNNCFTIQEVGSFLDQGTQPIVEVRTRLGRTLRCTSSHPLRTVEGWQPVSSLAPGAKVAALPRLFALKEVSTFSGFDWDVIESIVPAGEEPVYDLSVPPHANFVANDLIVHNSTLLLQMASDIAQSSGSVLYVSAEESAHQIKRRADRLNIRDEKLFIHSEIEVESILDQISSMKPSLVIVDSIQAIYSTGSQSSAGTVSQVRDCAAALLRMAKQSHVPIFLVGHVTKEGSIAGPRVLEHMVDAVLQLEGERFHAYRLLRSVKNRFGSTNEVGIFEMNEQGMVEVKNPSELFLAERLPNSPGSAITVSMEGTRPILVEVQALSSHTTFSQPRRTANGIDMNRLLLITAVLSTRVGMDLSEQDIFVNIVGGMEVDEPAADLAVAVAIASSYRNRPVYADLAILGEVGLSGELRSVGHLNHRLHEAGELGFKRAITPRSVLRRGDAPPAGIEVIGARTLHEALDAALVK